jgi:cyclic pyranopterin phosphate synthase
MTPDGSLTHIDPEGHARMVDVGGKEDTERIAIACGRVLMRPETLAMVRASHVKKGDVLTVAQIAGIQAAKRTDELIPLCHPLLITHIQIDLSPGGDQEKAWIDIEATVRTMGKTGVEMEALTAAAVAALTVYDMCKAVDRDMRVTDLHLVHKSGGRSGTWDLQQA